MQRQNASHNKSVTSKDVARLAGVSQSTVSRAFNSVSGKGVKTEARERIMAAAKELGYFPNLVARGMISGKTNVVGLVVGDNLGPFYNRIINLFIEKVQEIGKQCLVFKVPRQDQIDGIISRVIQFQVEAVIITASAMTKVMAAEYLYQKGHRNIGYIQFMRETSEEMEKKIGFYSRLRQYGIHQMQEEAANYDYDSGYGAGLKMLRVENPPTAIFCTSDLIAMGVMDAARQELGLEIPKDLSVIGYDDIPMAGWKAYDLTTIRLDGVVRETTKCNHFDIRI